MSIVNKIGEGVLGIGAFIVVWTLLFALLEYWEGPIPYESNPHHYWHKLAAFFVAGLVLTTIGGLLRCA